MAGWRLRLRLLLLLVAVEVMLSLLSPLPANIVPLLLPLPLATTLPPVFVCREERGRGEVSIEQPQLTVACAHRRGGKGGEERQSASEEGGE